MSHQVRIRGDLREIRWGKNDSGITGIAAKNEGQAAAGLRSQNARSPQNNEKSETLHASKEGVTISLTTLH